MYLYWIDVDREMLLECVNKEKIGEIAVSVTKQKNM